MARPHKSVQLPPCREFRALSNLYVRFPWYSVAVQESPDEVVVTLAPTDWPKAARRAAVVAAVWSLLLAVSWLLKPFPLHVARVAATAAVVCLSPLYFPLLRRLILSGKLPWLRFDKSRGVVHLFAGSRQVPISDVVAICDVIVPGRTDSEGESIDKTYELQLLIRQSHRTGFVLLAGGWHDSAAKRISSITSDIAKRLGIPHVAVDTVAGTITQHSPSV